MIEPIFEKSFIYDSYANRIGKGTLKAIQRFDFFKRKVSRNNTKDCFVLKADIRHYFETVDHETLIAIIKNKIADKNVLWLIRTILSNYKSKESANLSSQKGMPLGNLTSQFFANVYLNELDYYVKNNLKAQYYLRYVDDFVILESTKKTLIEYEAKIKEFLKTIKLELHPDKSRIIDLSRGICFLGFRIFYSHKLLKKSNILKIERKLSEFKKQHKNSDIIYDKIYSSMEGWVAYARRADTYNLRNKISQKFESYFPAEISSTEIGRIQKCIIFPSSFHSHS